MVKHVCGETAACRPSLVMDSTVAFLHCNDDTNARAHTHTPSPFPELNVSLSSMSISSLLAAELPDSLAVRHLLLFSHQVSQVGGFTVQYCELCF